MTPTSRLCGHDLPGGGTCTQPVDPRRRSGDCGRHHTTPPAQPYQPGHPDPSPDDWATAFERDPLDHDHGMLVGYATGRAGDAWEAAGWWRDDLDTDDRAHLVQTWPSTVGSLDGLPMRDRDAANRILLQRAIEDTAEQLDTNPFWRFRRKKHLEERLSTLQALRERRGHNVTLTDGTPMVQRVYLHDFDADNGHVAVAFGPAHPPGTPAPDPDAARNATILVPGTGTTLDNFAGQVHRTADLASTTGTVIGVKAADTVTVAWLGYDAPSNLLKAASPQRAIDGGPALGAYVDGLWAANANHPAANPDTPPGPHVALIGHSYGTRVAAEGALATPDRVARLVVAGTPGIGAEEHVSAARSAVGSDSVSSFTYGRDWLHTSNETPTWVQKAAGWVVRRQHGIPPNETPGSCDTYTHIPSREASARGIIDGLRQAFQHHSGYFNDPAARAELIHAAHPSGPHQMLRAA